MPTKRTRLVEAVTGGGKHGNLRLSSNKTIKNSSGERVKVSHKSDKQLQSSLSTTSEPHESGDTVANTETHLADDESVISSPPSNTSCGAETPKFSNEQETTKRELITQWIQPAIFSPLQNLFYTNKQVSDLLPKLMAQTELVDKTVQSVCDANADCRDDCSLFKFLLELLQNGDNSRKMQKQQIRKMKNTLRQRLQYLHERIANAIFSSSIVRDFKNSHLDHQTSKHKINDLESEGSISLGDYHDTRSEGGSSDEKFQPPLNHEGDSDSDNNDEGPTVRQKANENVDDVLDGDELHSIKFGKYGFLIEKKFEVTDVSDSSINVKLIKANVRALVQDGKSFTVFPNHICSIIGNAGVSLYHELLHYIYVTRNGDALGGVFINLRSLTFMLPLSYFGTKKQTKFQNFVLRHLPPNWQCAMLEYTYGDDDDDDGVLDERKLCVFTCNGVVDNELSNEAVADITCAYHLPSRKYAIELAGGVHALHLEAVLQLISWIGIEVDDQCWELGCGEMKLAFALSCAAEGGLVLATDQGEPYAQLVSTISNFGKTSLSTKDKSSSSRASRGVISRNHGRNIARRNARGKDQHDEDDDDDDDDEDEVEDTKDGNYEYSEESAASDDENESEND